MADKRDLSREEEEEYPEPLIVVKPDIQVNELFNERELNSLRQELKFFTEDELQAAIFQAQAEINAEMINKHTASNYNRFPPKNVKLQNLNKDQPITMQRSDSSTNKRLARGRTVEENVAPCSKFDGGERDRNNSSDENKIEKDEYDYDDEYDDDFHNSDDQHDEENQSEDNEETEDHEDDENDGTEHGESDDDAKEDNSNHQSQQSSPHKAQLNGVKHSNNNMINDTLQDLFQSQPEDEEDHVVFLQNKMAAEMPPFCENADLQQISQILENMNFLFEQLFQCIQVNKVHTDTLDDLEIERTNRRSKEFESRFNRAIYQVERNMKSLNKISRYNGNMIDIIKLKCLLRSTARLLEMVLHYIPLSGGAFFPRRFQLFIEILVDCGTLVSRLDFTTCTQQIATLAKHLRKLDLMIIKFEKERLEASSKQIKSSKSVRQRSANGRSSSAVGSRSSSTNVVAKTSTQRSSNMARMRKMNPDNGQFSSISRARSQSKLNTTAKNTKGLTKYASLDATTNSPYETRGTLSRAKSADLSAHELNNTTLQHISFDDLNHDDEEVKDDGDSRTVAVQAVQSTHGQGVQSSTAIVKDKGVQQGGGEGCSTRSLSRNSGVHSLLDLPVTSSRFDEVGGMDRVLSRIHNLELLALRQTSSSRTSIHQQQSTRYQSTVVQNQHLLSVNNHQPQKQNTKHSTYLDDNRHITNDTINQLLATNGISKASKNGTTNDDIKTDSDNALRNAASNEKKCSNLNTTSLIARLEMMKTDFLLMEQKYF